MTERAKTRRQHNAIDLSVALELWNAGRTVTQLAARFQCTRSAAQWAVDRAEQLCLGIARRGRMKPPEPEPPMIVLWS